MVKIWNKSVSQPYLAASLYIYIYIYAKWEYDPAHIGIASGFEPLKNQCTFWELTMKFKNTWFFEGFLPKRNYLKKKQKQIKRRVFSTSDFRHGLNQVTLKSLVPELVPEVETRRGFLHLAGGRKLLLMLQGLGSKRTPCKNHYDCGKPQSCVGTFRDHAITCP